MSEAREIEAKFDIDPAGRELLLALPKIGRFLVEERNSVAQDDVYFDTVEAHLAHAGATLRVRRSVRGTRMTFKGRRDEARSDAEAHVASRPEDEVPLTPEQDASVTLDAPLPAMDDVSPFIRARAIVCDRALYPVARLLNHRTTLLLRDADGATLELAIDDCVGTRLKDGREVSFDEVELEAQSADRVSLIEASQVLQELVPSLRPSRLTKLGRTLD